MGGPRRAYEGMLAPPICTWVPGGRGTVKLACLLEGSGAGLAVKACVAMLTVARGPKVVKRDGARDEADGCLLL